MKKQILYSILLLCFGIQFGNANSKNCATLETLLVNPPVNDLCANAIPIPVNPTLEQVSSVSGTTLGATYSAISVGCAAPNQVDVWYSFVATSSVQFVKFYNVVYSDPAASLAYQLFSGNNCGTTPSFACIYGEQNAISNLVVGQTYKMRVYYPNQSTTFAFDLAIFNVDPLINDECSNALTIPVNQGTATDLFLNTTDLGATASPYIGNCYNGEIDTWYSFTALNSVQIVRFFDANNNQTNKVFSLFTGDTCGSLTPVICNAEGVLENLTVGTTYTVRLLKNTNNTPTLSALKIQINTIEAPVNDNCENAITVVANPDLQKNFFVSGSTVGATSSLTNSTDRDVYYRFIATSTQHLIYFDNLANEFQYELFEENATCSNSDLLYYSEGLGATYRGNVYYNFTVGNAYIIRVKSALENVSALFDLSIRTHEIVPNGLCINAIEVPVNSTASCDLFATGITQAGFFGEPPYYNPNDATWYKFIATSKTHAIEFKDLDGVFLEANYQIFNSEDACETNESISYVGALKGYHNNLVIGNEYKLKLSKQNYVAPVSGAVKVCITTIPQPANDECASAIELQVNAINQTDYFINASTFGATNSQLENTCGGSADDDVWFSFVATSKFHTVTLSNISPLANNLKVAIYQGSDCTTMFLKKCGTSNSVPLNTLTIGETYKIRVYTESLGGNKFAGFKIAVTTIALAINDECFNAILVPTSTISNLNVTQVSAKGGSQSTEENTCNAAASDDDVWYEFVATETRHSINFNWTSMYPFMLNFSVYSGDCANLTQIFCSTVGVNTVDNLVVGQTYKIRFWSGGTAPSNAIYNLLILNEDPALVANTTQFTPQELVNDVLINNPCIAVSNITSSTGTNFGSVNGIGYFTNTNPLFPISSGIVLSTGDASKVGGPNLTTLSDGNALPWRNTSDSDLEEAILSATGTTIDTKNSTKLEFDFSSQNDFMSFNFLFASEEYGQFQCISSDAFAFLLTDINTGFTQNIGVVPGTTTPVSVITIKNNQYNASCASANQSFFGSSYTYAISQGMELFSPTNFNGHTVLMTASANIIPNNPYHIKMVIADGADATYDSAVFIQEGSFTSGTPQCLDRLELISFIDSNANGVKDADEIPFTNGSFVYQVNDNVENVEIASSNGTHTIFSVNPIDSYDISYSILPEFASYYSGATSFENISIPVGSGTQTLYFPITEIQGFSDLSVTIVPIGQPVAGSSYGNKVVYQNLGNIAAAGVINYTKDASVTISTTESGVIMTPTGFTYNFNNLAPFETRSFIIQMNVPTAKQTNENAILSSNISISSSTGDTNSSNDSFQISQTVVSEANFIRKSEAHGNKLNINTFTQEEFLFYTIYFENRATVSVNNILVQDLLDAQLDEESVRMVSASHNYTMERIGNQLIWNFDFIYLPSNLESGDLSKGYLTFKVKVRPGFEVGDIIPNFAEIYFDTNPAVITNTFLSEFETDLSTKIFTTNNILVYPNPTNSVLNVSLQDTNESLAKIVIYDMIGKVIETVAGNGVQETAINVANFTTGVYMIEITTDSNLKQVRKFIVN